MILLAPYQVRLLYGWWSSRVGNESARPYTDADEAVTNLCTPAACAASITL